MGNLTVAHQKSTYQDQALKLVALISIAEKIINNSSTFPHGLKQPMLDFCASTKDASLNPEPGFKKISSLKYLESDFLTYWNESAGYDTELFWEEVRNNNLDFIRKDVIKVVLLRGKIKNLHEFNIIIDSLVVAQQMGRINNEQIIKLNQFISDFESRRKK